MIPSPLDNELVRKYFGIGMSGQDYSEEKLAWNILQAMQQPIRKGELVLERFPSDPINEWQVTKAPKDFDADIHSAWLRLPDAFQPTLTEEKDKPCSCQGVIMAPCKFCGAALRYGQPRFGIGCKPTASAEKCDGEHQGKPCPELHPEPKDAAVEEKCEKCGK